MSDNEMDFDQLFTGMVKNERIKAEARVVKTVQLGGQGQSPDALVLVVTEITCLCGRSYISPNSTMLVRYGVSYTKPKKWLYAYNYVKREKLVRMDKAQSCDECFDQGYWDFTTLEKEK